MKITREKIVQNAVVYFWSQILNFFRKRCLVDGFHLQQTTNPPGFSLATDFLIETIPILSQQMDWVGEVRKMAFFADVQYNLCWRRVGGWVRKRPKMCWRNIGMVLSQDVVHTVIYYVSWNRRCIEIQKLYFIQCFSISSAENTM